MITTTIDATGLNLKINALTDKLKDTTPMMELIGDYVVGSVRKNIDDGGRPNKYPSNIRGNNPLNKTGESYRAIRKELVTATSVTVTSGGGNAGYSNTGHWQNVTDKMRGYFYWQYKLSKEIFWLKMSRKDRLWKPERKYMMFQEPVDVDAIKNIVSDYLDIK
jgi:phage gpG-like protein